MQVFGFCFASVHLWFSYKITCCMNPQWLVSYSVWYCYCTTARPCNDLSVVLLCFRNCPRIIVIIKGKLQLF